MFTRGVLSSLMLALLASGAGCSDPSSPPRIEEAEFAPELEIDLAMMTKIASGLYIEDLMVGAGDEAVAGTTAFVHYTGWFTNGTEFDSNQPDDVPLHFVVGGSGVIRGFGEGVRGMREGGQRRLIIPPSLGYGNNPPAGFPKNVILVFVIDLVDVQ